MPAAIAASISGVISLEFATDTRIPCGFLATIALNSSTSAWGFNPAGPRVSTVTPYSSAGRRKSSRGRLPVRHSRVRSDQIIMLTLLLCRVHPASRGSTAAKSAKEIRLLNIIVNLRNFIMKHRGFPQ